MNSQRLRNTSSPKLTVPIVQEAMSGPASSTASRAASGSVTAPPEESCTIRSVASRSAATVVAQPALVERRLGGVVADVDVDHARAERLALLGRGHQLVEGHRQGRHLRLGRLRAGRGNRDQRRCRHAGCSLATVASRLSTVGSGRVDARPADGPTRSAASSATFRFTTASAIVPSS